MKTAGPQTPFTKTQAIILIAWFLNIATVLAIWEQSSLGFIFDGGLGGILTALGRLFGLLAAFFALTQFLLMGRLRWLERPFGLSKLAVYHRQNGQRAFIFIILHPIFITLGYALTAGVNPLAQYVDLIFNYQYVWLAFIAELLFITVVVSSLYIVRRKLKFENWYYVHLLVYVAITTAFFHQVVIGSSFVGWPLARGYWLALYGFVIINLIIWRFSVPTINMFRFDFRIARVVRETPTAVSLYIGGRGLRRWGARPGQFVLIRILSKRFGRQEHPFSLSSIVTDDTARLTIRELGDYTKELHSVTPGTRVLLSGPFGRFTDEAAVTKKRLYIAGGVGITPLRPLSEAALAAGHDSVLLYSNRDPSDVVFEDELKALEAKGLRLQLIFSDTAGPGQLTGRITPELISKLVPDFLERDVYICGPPPMMQALASGLTTAGLAPGQLHIEFFDLHA